MSRVNFPGAVNSKFTTELNFVHPEDKSAMPTFRILNQDGAVIDKSVSIDVTDEEAIKLYKDMLTGKQTAQALAT